MMIFNGNASCDKEKNRKRFWTFNLNSEGSKQRQCQYTLAFSSKAVFAFEAASEQAYQVYVHFRFF